MGGGGGGRGRLKSRIQTSPDLTKWPSQPVKDIIRSASVWETLARKPQQRFQFESRPRMSPWVCARWISQSNLGQGLHAFEAGDQIRPAVGEDFLGHTEESATTGSLGVWGRGASNSLVPSGGPSRCRGGYVALALITPWLRQVAFPYFLFFILF